MVKKLFKHEMHALWRLMIPIWCILFGVSVLGRLIQFFEQDSIAYNIVNSSAIFFYVVSLIACLVCPFVFAVIRFYRNLFSGEGYLTFTLPVTNHQHILVKWIAAVITEVVTLFAAAISVMLITFGDVAWEISKAAWYLIKLSVRAWGGHLPMYIVEAVIGVIAVFAVETMLFYTCICIGQLSRKNRILTAAGAYFGFYALKQVVGTMVLLMATVIDWVPLFRWIGDHPFATIHMLLWGGIAVEAFIGYGLYWLSHRLITHRLNLE